MLRLRNGVSHFEIIGHSSMSSRLKDTVLCVCVLLSALSAANGRILVMALQNLMQGCKCSV